MVDGDFVAAAGAVLIRDADGAVAVSAGGGELIAALRAEVEVALDVGAAGVAAGDDGLAEEEVEDSANTAGKNEADQHPETSAHGSAGSVAADVTDHEEVHGGEDAPGEVEVGAQADGRGCVVALFGEDEPEVVLDREEGDTGGDHGPDGDEARVFIDRDGLWVTHGVYPQLT